MLLKTWGMLVDFSSRKMCISYRPLSSHSLMEATKIYKKFLCPLLFWVAAEKGQLGAVPTSEQSVRVGRNSPEYECWKEDLQKYKRRSVLSRQTRDSSMSLKNPLPFSVLFFWLLLPFSPLCSPSFFLWLTVILWEMFFPWLCLLIYTPGKILFSCPVPSTFQSAFLSFPLPLELFLVFIISPSPCKFITILAVKFTHPVMLRQLVEEVEFLCPEKHLDGIYWTSAFDSKYFLSLICVSGPLFSCGGSIPENMESNLKI